jgi:sensor histidine kinase YesM
VAKQLGLANLALRYRLIYGDRATMRIRSSPGLGTRVEIDMPVPIGSREKAGSAQKKPE